MLGVQNRAGRAHNLALSATFVQENSTLRNLCASAVKENEKHVNRRGAEDAEITQRSSELEIREDVIEHHLPHVLQE